MPLTMPFPLFVACTPVAYVKEAEDEHTINQLTLDDTSCSDASVVVPIAIFVKQAILSTPWRGGEFRSHHVCLTTHKPCATKVSICMYTGCRLSVCKCSPADQLFPLTRIHGDTGPSCAFSYRLQGPE